MPGSHRTSRAYAQKPTVDINFTVKYYSFRAVFSIDISTNITPKYDEIYVNNLYNQLNTISDIHYTGNRRKGHCEKYKKCL